MIESIVGSAPGLDSAYTTYENAFSWGGPNRGLIQGAIISSAAVDAGASPTYRLRPGLVLGKVTSTGELTNYDPTATDGSQVAVGVLLTGLRMQDVLSGSTVDKFVGVLMAGPIQAGKLYGLDAKARADMFGRFIFDDDLFGNRGLYRREVTKTANHVVLASENGTDFISNSSAAIVFTLPALATGLYYRFRSIVNFSMTITAETNNTIVGFNDAAAGNVIFNTASQTIGACAELFTNAAGTKWYVNQLSPGNTITFT